MKPKGKTIWVKVVCFLLAVIMLMTCFAPLITYAAEPESLVVTGEYNGRFKLKTSEEKLFDISEAAPGDKYEGTITVKNAGSDMMKIAIVDIMSNLSDTDLYKTLNLKISKDGEVLYDGVYGNTPDPVTKFITVKGRDKIVFDVEVSFPELSSNDLQGKEMDTTWTFEAKYYNQDIETGVELNDSQNATFPLILICLGIVLIAVSVYCIIILKRKEEEQID